MRIVAELEGALRFPEAIGERLGLSLSHALETDETLAPRLRAALEGTPPEDPAQEQSLVTTQMHHAPAAPEVTAPPEEKAPEGIEVAPGVWLSRPSKGRIVLRGDGIPADLDADLAAWLAERLG